MNDSMKVKEEGLRRRIGSDCIIGCYQLMDDGRAFFTDIRGEEGDLVKIPNMDVDEIKVECPDLSLIPNTFYQFHWKLSEPGLRMIMVGSAEPVDNKSFLHKLFNARLRLQGSNLELFNNFQKTIFNEVTGAQHTYIYELLQNANDYPYQKEKVKVRFVLTDHYLFFLHSGDYFNLRNVVGISSVNQGEKSKNTETIGYKGIGFKTVFVNNEYVYLKSGEWSLRFDRSYSEEQFFGECPWALMPIPTEDTELDEEIKHTLSATEDEMRVQFALRHKSNARNNLEQLDKVFSDNQILLFIPYVCKVEVVVDGKNRHVVEKDQNRWVVNDFSYEIPEDLRIWVEQSILAGEKVPEKFKDIKYIRISFAIGKEGNKLQPIENARVYNYLPTELRLGFNFLFNADFIPNGSRSGLHDVKWNDHVMKRCGFFFAEWFASFLAVENSFDMASVFALLPELTNRDHYGALFLKGFSERIMEIPCIPVLYKGEYKLVRLDQIIFDKIGVVSARQPLFTDEEFYLFTGKKGFLPHPRIRCNEHLIRLLGHYGKCIVYNGSDLTDLPINTAFQTWLCKKENNIKFLGYLMDTRYLSRFWKYAIFIKADGNLAKAETIYYDIDKYIDDISFLASNLPRLDADVRKALEGMNAAWKGNAGRFKEFRTDSFIKTVFSNYQHLSNKFTVKDNNIRFLHFLAVTNYMEKLPDFYPLYSDQGKAIYKRKDTYLKNEVGESLAGHKWIKAEWINFIHDDYMARDKDLFESYLSRRCDIHALSYQECYTLFIADKNRVSYISQNIQNAETSVDFYHYLSEIQENIGNFTQEMRLSYTLRTTDGMNESWTPVTKTIFWKDEEWEQMANVDWMPANCCVAVSDIYFDGLDEETATKVRTLFTTKQLVQHFRMQTFFTTCLRLNIDGIFSKINSKENSCNFLNFLFENRNAVIKDINSMNLLRGTPILCYGEDHLKKIKDFSCDVFFPNHDVIDLYLQPWFYQQSIRICDECYIPLFDGKDRQDFFKRLGINSFDRIEFARNYQLKHLDIIRDKLKKRDNNLSFYRYFSEIHEDLSENDMAAIKELPIFISSPEKETGVMVQGCTNHYLPSEQLTEIIQKDLVPIDILDSIHPDYILSDRDKKFFSEKLENPFWDLEEFIDYIVKRKDVVSSYLKNVWRNISFWQWACSLTLKYEKIKALGCFPLLCKESNPEKPIWALPGDLFISNAYNNGVDIEDFINEYVKDARFVSDCYAEHIDEGKDYNWKYLFKAIGMTVDVKEIVLKKVLPNLIDIKKTNVVFLLAEYYDSFSRSILTGDLQMKEALGNLQLLCDDGVFRTVRNVLVSGKYFDLTTNPFPDIVVGILVSEKYITDCGDKEELRRKVVKFVKLMADSFGMKCETATQLRDFKLKFFMSHQRDYIQGDTHYKIIAQLNEAYNRDSEGVDSLIGNNTILLYNDKDILVPSQNLYLSSVYHPACDYMSYGVSDLKFVSEDYTVFSNESFNRFFKRLQIKDSFTSQNFTQLANIRFAIYFWNDYARKNEIQLKDLLIEENLRNIPCIPSPLGVRKPNELYDYRNQQLQKMVLKLNEGNNKLPSVVLPEWMSKAYIGFRSRLYFSDCLEYMALNILDYRRDVMKWITDTNDETVRRYRRRIEDYCEKALWLNGEKNWAPLKELRALEWENKTLKDNFSGNAFVCNPSYMPESKNDYDKLCIIFNIQILTNRDFQKRKEGKFFKDNDAIIEIKKRLLYLAYKAKVKDWKILYEEYSKKLMAADVSSVERIVYYYNEKIETDLQVYAEDDKALWYVNGWNGPMFLAVLDWVIKKIGVKGDFDSNFLQKLFLNPFNSFIKKQEGGALPKEILACLDEVDKIGLREDELDESERFVEGDFSSSNHSEKSQGDDVEHGSQSSHTSAQTQRTTRMPIERKQAPQTDPKENSQKTSKTNGRDTVPSQKKSTEDKLREEFETKAKINVGRPAASSHGGNVNAIPTIQRAPDNTTPDPSLGMDTPTADKRRNDHGLSPASRTSQAISRNNTEAQTLVEQAAEQLDIYDLLQKTKEYSYLWYKYLMKLAFADKAKSSRRSAQIDFNSFELICDNKILHLEAPNLVIPSWMEDASVSILSIGKDTRKVSGSIVKIDDMEVDIMLKPDDVSKLQGATKIRINAENMTNIIDSLEIRFLQLGYEDNYDMNANLPNDINFIYGPPGTGKTTRLVERLHEIVGNTDRKLNILVLTPTNKAADVIAEKIASDEVCFNYLIRFGSTESRDIIEKYAVLSTRDTIDLELLDNNIVVTTAARYAYDYFQADDVAICDFNWDYIVVDEASMIDLITITYILHKGKSSKFIIAGDPKQIQPISDIVPWNVYDMVGLDSFKDAIQNYKRFPVEALMVQHRSVPSIGNLVSNFAYDGLLRNDSQRAPQKPLVLDGIPVKDVNFIGFKIEDFGDGLYSLLSIDTSAFHLYAAIFTYNMVDYAVKQITAKYPDGDYKIGVICPYKAEANAIQQLLEHKPLDTNVCKVSSGTVHRFQGDECDIMFIILNPPSNASSGTHINKLNIINVALSRARDYIFFIVPDKVYPGFFRREELWKLVEKENKTVQTCPDIEKTIFGSSNYIDDNTNVTPHLPVNVYYDTYALYEVRIDESTLDIQINDKIVNEDTDDGYISQDIKSHNIR